MQLGTRFRVLRTKCVAGPTETPMEQADLSATVLAHVNHADYRPVKPRVIAKQLGLEEEQLRQLKKSIKLLVKQGKIAYGSNHLVVPVASTAPKDGKPHTEKTG